MVNILLQRASICVCIFSFWSRVCSATSKSTVMREDVAGRDRHYNDFCIGRWCADFQIFGPRQSMDLDQRSASIFQDGGRRHLGFRKFQIFNGWDAQEDRSASACQILSKSLKTRLRYGNFSIFQDGGCPPSWIFKSWKFQLPVRF